VAGMNWKRASETGSVLAVVVTALACGTFEAVPAPHVATNGRGFIGRTAMRDAVRESAVHDLPCSRDAVSVQRLLGGTRAPTEIMADGCGQRAIYRIACEWHQEDGARCRVLLMGTLSLTPPARTRAP
jgi:hypothetical protein